MESEFKGNPWRIGNEPVSIYIPARRIPGWRLDKRTKLVQKWGDGFRVREGNIIFMTKLPSASAIRRASKKEQIVELVPYGCTNLRVAWFPVV